MNIWLLCLQSDHEHEHESGMNKGYGKDNDMKGMDEVWDMKGMGWEG